MDSTFLLNHAQQKIWSSPYQDLQAVIKPHRLTGGLGTKDTFALAWNIFPLPSTDSRYHVYQLGRLHPALVGMLPVKQTWSSASAQCNVQGLVIDVYTNKGLKLPLFDVFFRTLGNDNLVIAIRDQGRLLDLSLETISIRFYSNAYFESIEGRQYQGLPESFFKPVLSDLWTLPSDLQSTAHAGDILVQGARIRSRNDVLEFDQKVNQLRALGYGGVTCYYNGEWVPDFSGYHYTSARVRRDDWLEFVFDASINKVQVFNISDLKTFQSIKDGNQKYILMRDTPWTGEIFYKDDFDFYLLAPQTANRRRGRYYYRNIPSAVRMITHQDYSVSASHVNAYVDQEAGFVDPMGWQIMIVYRASGYSAKSLINESARLNEFFKLPSDKRLMALQGINSTVDWWKAANLENSSLSVLFGERPFAFTTKQVEDALGYYGVSSLLNPGLMEVSVSADGVTRHVNLPMGLQLLSTIFEYSQDGRLLGYRSVEGAGRYVCSFSDCHYVEGIAGKGNRRQGTFFGAGPHKLDPDWDYGWYKKPKVAGVPTGDWLVATPEDYTVDSSNQGWWNIDSRSWHLVIRTNRDFLLYEIDVDARDGLSIFSIQAIEENVHEPFNHVEDLPYGQLDVFLNGHPLVRGIDYTGNWPQFVITNVECLKPGGLQRLTLRCAGLPETQNGKPINRTPTEIGFVKHGKLSRNRKYNARNGKVQRFVVRGKVMHSSKLNFSEDGEPVKPSPVVNGDPYSIEEMVVATGNFTEADSTSLRKIDVERDVVVETYMGQFFNDTPKPHPNPIPERYRLVSPLMTKVIHDIKHNILQVPRDILPLTQTKLTALLKDYLYLLPYDPINLGLDWDNVQVIPHGRADSVVIGVHEYHVLALANRVYFGERLDLSKYVIVDPAWTPETLPPLL